MKNENNKLLNKNNEIKIIKKILKLLNSLKFIYLCK
jgi:hypothetical protein